MAEETLNSGGEKITHLRLEFIDHEQIPKEKIKST